MKISLNEVKDDKIINMIVLDYENNKVYKEYDLFINRVLFDLFLIILTIILVGVYSYSISVFISIPILFFTLIDIFSDEKSIGVFFKIKIDKKFNFDYDEFNKINSMKTIKEIEEYLYKNNDEFKMFKLGGKLK